MLIGMSTTQIAIRLDDRVLRAVDELVDAGDMASRADVVREALSLLFERREKQRMDRLMVEGYDRLPSTDREAPAAEASLRAAIEEEQW